jgi:drug/metabolite transporter (DMT)-like permease
MNISKSGMSEASESTDVLRLAVVFVLVAVLVSSLQSATIKWLSDNLPAGEILFLRSAFALLPAIVIVYLEGGLALLRSQQPGLQLLRAVCMLLAYLCFYMAVAAMPLADAVSLAFSSPLFVAALSGPLLGEWVGPRRWLAVIVGFLGVLIILRPGTGLFEPVALLAATCALFYGLATVTTRRLGRTDRGSAMAFYTIALYVAASALLGLGLGDGRLAGGAHPSLEFLTRPWSLPSSVELGLLALLGLMASVGTYLLSQAYRIGQPASIASFEYTAVPLSVLWGYLFWHEVPGLHTLLGSLLIIASGLYLLRREPTPPTAKANA